MERRTFHLSLAAVLLSCSAALAQTGSNPPTQPPATESMPSPRSVGSSPVASPLNQPVLQPTAPSAPPGATWPPPGQPVVQPTTPCMPPPGQPVYPPPGQPVYPPPAGWVLVPAGPMWQPPPSPGLGLVPGETNPRWDVSFEALWLERDTDRSVSLGFTRYNPGSHARQAIPSDHLWSDDALFTLQPGIRLQLVGRITDQMAIEASCWGLQHWSVGHTIFGDPAGRTVLAHSDWLQTADFDNSLGYTLTSDVANVEINQRFKWLSFDPYRSLSWLWGVRYFYLSDDFGLNGSDLGTGTFENLSWRTKNNLIGAQLGLQWAWGWDRFQLSAEAKVGLFANAYAQQGIDAIGGPVNFQQLDASHSGTDLAALVEFSLLARFRLTSCMWLRAGYQCYGVTGLATGPRQLGGYDSSGSVGLDGLSLGLELTR
jgi:hypothetical protein